ncbi:hypothetical protein J41TS12_10860 [Paenibacillus antibioticophila]|uniref:Uncharacterized protein n=1 Tax=Paenibacillus antibioticophila TaxID=1274374 RepID=A0A919XSS1_9BACL|nr:hypothetical protein [Paenibacillus antibioticophila]GIO36225.1 hypothetical protein J41TS12_10860 [Paenibacillus antibioticophila]
MELQVNPQTKRFWYPTNDGWRPMYGHEITVGGYKFSVCAIKTGELISEVTTGMRVKLLADNPIVQVMGEDKEGMISYYEFFVVPFLKSLVESNLEAFNQAITDGQKRIKALGIGDMPPIEDYDDRFMTEPVSEIKH